MTRAGEDRVRTLMTALEESVAAAKEARDQKMRRERPQIVLRDDCRPDELCICCRREMGDHHDVLCYVYANNRLLSRDG